MSELRYLDPVTVTDTVSEDRAPRYGQTVSGYGAKIPTRHRVRIGRRWHRVYVMVYGNSGSPYVITDGQVTHLDIDTEYRLMAN